MNKSDLLTATLACLTQNDTGSNDYSTEPDCNMCPLNGKENCDSVLKSELIKFFMNGESKLFKDVYDYEGPQPF